jgi:hypothetical protein
MWRTAGAHQILQLVVIAPLAYRNGSRSFSLNFSLCFPASWSSY